LPETSDDIVAHDIYGKHGEKKTGPFKKKYSDHKQTRFGTFAYAYLNLTAGEKANFQYLTNDKPEDYSDVNVWMEEEKVEIKDNYYDVTMKSNLNALTRINASIVVNNNEHSGLDRKSVVCPDGSFRFRIPKPDIQ